MNIVFAVIFSICSALFTKVFWRLAQNTRLLDKPNNRSSHTIPVVRGGGLVFIGLIVLALPLLCFYTQTPLYDFIPFILSTILLAMVSFIDDLYNLSFKIRLLFQTLVAVILAISYWPFHLQLLLFDLSNPAVVLVFVVLGTLWSINHFNFMDGIDGLCALQAVFLCAAYGLLFCLSQAFLYQDFCLLIVFSLLGFLVFNFPPAKLFMGDVGSAVLGLIVFAIALIGQQKFHIPIAYWFLLNALFLFDATFTLIRRMIRKENWTAAHRKHAYQRLKQAGMNNRLILLGQGLVNVCFLVLVLLVFSEKLSIDLALLLEFMGLSLIYFLIESIEPMV